jgi:hypothetical protein
MGVLRAKVSGQWVDIAVGNSTVVSNTPGNIAKIGGDGLILVDPYDVVAASRQLTNIQGSTAYTLVLGDENKLVWLQNASAITLTVPTNATVPFPLYSRLDLVQAGAGKVTVAGASGVTVQATPSLGFRAQWSAATLYKYGTDTWLLTGDLA